MCSAWVWRVAGRALPLGVLGLCLFAAYLSAPASAATDGLPARVAEDTLAASTTTIRPVTAALLRSFPPFYQTAPDGTPAGFAREVMDQVAVAAGLRVQYLVVDDWRAAQAAVRDGRAHLIPGMVPTPERRREFAFTSPIFVSSCVLLARDADRSIQAPQDLARKTVGLLQGALIPDPLGGIEGIRFQRYGDSHEALSDLLAGRLDAIVGAGLEFRALVAQREAGTLVRVVEVPGFEYKRAIALRPGDPDLLTRLETATRAVIRSPAYAELVDTWYGPPRAFWTLTRLAILFGLTLFGCVVGLGLWHYRATVRLNAQLTRALADARQAETALQHERDLLRAVMDGAQNAHLVYLDRDFNFVRVNATYAAGCGYTPEGMVGKNHFTLYPHPEIEAIFARVRDTGEPYAVYDKPFTFPDQPERGTTYWDWTLTPVKDAAGCVTGLVFALFETTVRKRAEEALAARTAQLEALQEVSAEIVHELTLDRVLALILERAAALVRVRGGVIHLWDAASRTLYPQARIGEAFAALPKRPLPLGEGLIGQAAAAKQSLVVNDYRAWPHARPDTLAHTRVTAALAEPLLVADRLVGVINLVHEDGGGTFTPEDQALLRLFAQQAAIAIENARLFAAAQRERQEADLLATIARRISASLDLDATLQAVVDGARELGNADIARLALRADTAGGETFPIRYRAGVVGEAYGSVTVRPGRGLGGQVLRTGQPARTAAHRDDPAVEQSFAALVAAEGVIAMCVVPVICDTRIEGLLFLDRRTASPFTDREEQLLVRLAGHAALALANARLYAATRTQAGQLAELAAVTQTLTGTLESAQVAQAILAAVPRLLPGAAARLWQRVPGQADRIALTAEIGTRQTTPNARTTVAAGEGLSGLALQSRQPVVSAALATDPRLCNRAWAAAEGFVSALIVPLLQGETSVGTLVILTRTPHAFTDDEVAMFQALAAHAAIALETARLFAELSQTFVDLQAAQATLLQGEKLRALGQLAGGVAHTLNNKLFVVLGNLTLLTGEVPGLPTDLLGPLQAAAEEAALVVRQLQEFTQQRPSGGAPGLVDLNAALQDLVALTRPQWKDGPEAAGAPITLRVDVPALPPISGDAAALQEALTHLILNACEAMPAGGTLTLTGAADPAGAWVELTVTDTGVGMPPEVQAKLFEPFFTTKGVQRRGLGLATAYGIVERHGGRLTAASVPGVGTTLCLRLPTAPPRAPAVPPRSRRLLVVDDEAAVRTTTAALLRTAGHTVVEAATAAAALAAVAATPPEVVVTDLGMPEMTGWELAHRIHATHPALPVVLLTGWQDDLPGGAQHRAAVAAILRKPVPLPDLLQTIETVARPAAGAAARQGPAGGTPPAGEA